MDDGSELYYAIHDHAVGLALDRIGDYVFLMRLGRCAVGAGAERVAHRHAGELREAAEGALRMSRI